MPIFLAICAGLCWGIGEVATRAALHTKEIGPFAALAVRSTIALPLIWIAYLTAAHALALPTEPRNWPSTLTTPTWAKLILGSGLVAGAAAMIFFYTALSMAEISRIKPIAFALAPVTAVILGWLLLGESMTPRKAIAVALILVGVILLTGGTHTKPTAPTAEATQ